MVKLPTPCLYLPLRFDIDWRPQITIVWSRRCLKTKHHFGHPFNDTRPVQGMFLWGFARLVNQDNHLLILERWNRQIWSMSLHPCFRRRWLLQVCLGKALWTSDDISAFLWLRKQQPRFAQGQPKGYFLTKELYRTTEAFARMTVVWEGPVWWVQCANMWQDCSLTAVQRKTACVEQSWWPEFDTFGWMPWCSLANAKELLKSTV